MKFHSKFAIRLPMPLRDRLRLESERRDLTSGDVVRESLEEYFARRPVPAPWQFLKPDGTVGICSWCERDQGHSPSPHDTHGICPSHLAEMRAELAARRTGTGGAA